MKIKQINRLISGDIAACLKIINLYKCDPAVNFHLLFISHPDNSIEDFVKILYPTNEYILPVEDFYYRVSNNLVTDAEKKAIADLLHCEVSDIWRVKDENHKN